jgi:hypothetical protein
MSVGKKTYTLILNYIAEIVWIAFDGGKGVVSVKYEVEVMAVARLV